MSSSHTPASGATPRTPRRLRRHAALLAAGAAATLALGACGADDDEAPPRAPGPAVTGSAGDAGPTYARYVALGDSFAALGPVAAPTTGPPGCLRSTANYPALLAEGLGGTEFVDVSCGGARTGDMTGRQIAETPPQFDALTPGTDLVTLSIGGNDIGFGDIAGCIMTTRAGSVGPDGAPCRDRLERSVADALDALPARLDAVYDGIRDRSPGARIIATGYMPLVPADGGCDFVASMTPGDVTWTRQVTERISLIVADAARRAGADLVLPEDAAARSACAPTAERYTDFTGVETGSHPMHPTAAGQRAMADAVAGML